MLGGLMLGATYLGQASPVVAVVAVVVVPVPGARSVIVPAETRTVVVPLE